MTRIWSAELAAQCGPTSEGGNCVCGSVDKRGSCGTNTITGPTFGPNALRRNTWVHLAAVYDPTGGATDGQMFGEGSSVRDQYIFYINGAPYYNNAFASFLPNRGRTGVFGP